MGEINFKISPRLLDHIGLAMYSSLPKAISELVANSYDADAENVYITIPKDLTKDEIIVEDDGSGMDRQFIENIYMNLGGMNRTQESTPRYGRLKIGSKGIGKLAGLGIANVMRVETIKDKKKYSLEINREQMEKETRTLEKITFPIDEERIEGKNGTKISLKKLLSHVSSIDEEKLRRFLTSEFVHRENFHMWVNGEEISAEDVVSAERRNIKDLIEGCGEVKGYILIADKPSVLKKYKLKPGVVTTVRNRRVLGPTLFDINAHGHWYRVAERIFGEIEATFLDPEKPEEALDGFIISTSRDGFNKNHPKFIKYKEWVENKLIKICRRLEAEQAKERKRRILQSREFRRILIKLPPELRNGLREKVRDMVENIGPLLNELPPKRAETVMKALLKIIESGELVTILEKIEKASEEDVKKLAAHLTSWGLYEINTIVEHIRYRLSIISKFEKLLESVHTLEYPTIHKLFETNLWLLDDEYRLYSSNQQLKTTLEDKIKKKFKRHKEARPDLIVKSLRNDVVIVELKRPSHIINSDDFSQLNTYNSIVRSHLPNTKILKCYLIGKEFDEAVRNPEFEKIGIYMLSFFEVLQRAKEKYRELLSKLGR